jgi:hypothetical protein
MTTKIGQFLKHWPALYHFAREVHFAFNLRRLKEYLLGTRERERERERENGLQNISVEAMIGAKTVEMIGLSLIGIHKTIFIELF